MSRRKRNSLEGIIDVDELEFFLRHECYIYPYCALVPSDVKCIHIEASGRNCSECKYKANSYQEKAAIITAYNKIMPLRVERHYKFISSKKWKDSRKPIIEYDNSRCIICGRELKSHHTVHHVFRFSVNADLTIRNLVTLCNECHIKLEPVYPIGMYKLGWPDMELFVKQLKQFYQQVRRASSEHSDRLRVPLEHVMDHLCFICPSSNKCPIGIDSKKQIIELMKKYESTNSEVITIADLVPSSKRVTVEGTLIDKKQPKVVETRYGETKLSLGILRDETGTINLPLFNDNINLIEVGDKVRIENAYVSVYEGRLNLNIPRGRGKIIKLG